MLCWLFSLTSDSEGSFRSPTDPTSSVDPWDVMLSELLIDVGDKSGESAVERKIVQLLTSLYHGSNYTFLDLGLIILQTSFCGVLTGGFIH